MLARTKLLICLFTTTLILILFYTAVVAVPPPRPARTDIDGLQVQTPATAKSSTPPTALSASEAAIDFEFCDIDVYQFTAYAGTDVWGWDGPDGTEYAIMGVAEGLAFVNVTARQVVQIVNGPTTGCSNIRWRDIKTYRNYCYAVSECSGVREGVMIIDMQFLPDSVHFVKSWNTGGQNTSHNLNIDTARGFAYTVGKGGSRFRVIDLSFPENPVHVNWVFVPNLHDIYARNDTVWAAEGTAHTFSIWDMTDKMAPQMIARIGIPANGYAHNIWASDIAPIMVTTEETAFHRTKIWDVSDYDNIQMLSSYAAPSELAHNAHIVDDILLLSHYESGVVAVDISDPAHPVELDQFDTWRQSEDPNFNGNWGIYPHTKSGLVYASNLDGKLFILSTTVPETDETLIGGSANISRSDTKVRVDLSLENKYPLEGILIPFNWAGDLNMTLDSVSTAGLRTDYFEDRRWMALNLNNSEAAYSIKTSIDGSLPDLPPGDGPILSLHFSIPEFVVGAVNPITFENVGGNGLKMTSHCLTYFPTFSAAYVLADATCCETTVGNVDLSPDGIIDIGDVTLLISSLFVTLKPLDCPDEANVDGSQDGVIDIGDLTVLLQTLFINVGAPFIPCP